MIVEIIDAASAVPEVNVKDIDSGEDCTWRDGLLTYMEYQSEYWNSHKHYARTLENLVNDN